MSAGQTLQALLDGIASPPPPLARRPVAGLCLDSRALQPGEIFVALAGARTHGLQHAGQARERGALCVLAEAPLPAGSLPGDDVLPVDGLRGWLGELANRLHRSPSAAMAVIGVTGTNGKTSTVQLLAQALGDDPVHGPCGHVGTLGIGLGDWHQPGERTTPDVLAVHAALAELLRRGARAVAMEVSSHALDQGRVEGVAFRIAAFSNLTRDHLDYHGDMAAYGAAKAKLFEVPGLANAVINLDDGFGAGLAGRLAPALPLWTVSATGATSARLHATQVSLDSEGLAFELVEGHERQPVRSVLLGRFNVDNLLLVAGCLRALGLGLSDVAARLGRLRPVAGRMDRVGAAADQPLVVVDYAHTPDALRQALQSLRAHTRGRLVCLFGCGGERDRGKRPLMAQIAESGADRVVLTDDNPRNEDGDQIVAEILAGFSAPDRVEVCRDREQAIALALSLAAAGDSVLLAGKGHEAYQESRGQRKAFDDARVARRWLEARAA